jgi:lactobin A/cerein 7B family class IIb bacteriocin
MFSLRPATAGAEHSHTRSEDDTMQNLSSYGVLEMTDAEMTETDGGVAPLLVAALFVGMLLLGACPAE